MAWITGKIQKSRRNPPKVVNVGDPVAYKKDGKWYSYDTHKELYLYFEGTLKEFIEGD